MTKLSFGKGDRGVINDPEILASLQTSAEAQARIDHLTRPKPWRPPFIVG